MAKYIALALLSLAFAADLKQKLEGDGLLFHSIDFLQISQNPGYFTNYWYDNPNTSLYLSSFSYVNSATPKVAGRAGILVDPKHPDVKLHAIANSNGSFNSYKFGTGQTSSACVPGSRQFAQEKQIVQRACAVAFQYANDSYYPRQYDRYWEPAKGFFNHNNMIDTLKANDRDVRFNWSEIVASVPAHAIAGVIDFDNAPSQALDPTQRVEGLCREMRKKNPNIPCFRAQSGIITPLMPLATPPRVPTQSTTAPPATPRPVPVHPTTAPPAPVQPTPPQPSDPPPPQRTSTPTWVLCVIILAIVCLLVFRVYRFCYPNSKKRKEKDYPIEEETAEKDENEKDFALSVSSLSSWPSGAFTLRKRRSLTSMSFEEM